MNNPHGSLEDKIPAIDQEISNNNNHKHYSLLPPPLLLSNSYELTFLIYHYLIYSYN